MKRIKFVDLEKLHNPIMNNINKAINKIIQKNNYILGEELIEFEENWAKYTKQKYAVAVSSGYSALELSKQAVISLLEYKYCWAAIPTNSFIATANAYNDNDHPIYFLDVYSDNLLLDIEKLEDKLEIGQPVNCIVPVHLFGQPCNMDKLEKLANKYNSQIIEDACQGHGIDSKLIGKGVTTCYSFYPSKNLGCFGDGGIITTNDKDIADKLRLLRSYGEIEKNRHDIIGYNCRLDTIQAAILNIKINYLDEWNENRRDVAKQYHEELENVDNLKLLPYNKDSVYHLFIVEVNDRNGLKNYLLKNGIETGIHYPIPIHKQRAYYNHNNISLPVAEDKARRILSLPMHPCLQTEEISHICNRIREFCHIS